MNIAARKSIESITFRRRWGFRLVAMLMGPVLFIVAELLCAVFGLGMRDVGDDPYVEFSRTRPLFELTPDGSRYQTADQRLGFFRRVEFERVKSPNEFRIFVVGGSTVQGHPYSIETSFPACLQTALNHASPSVSWNVVNCGGVSYASYRLVPVVEECLRYEPDLIIFCEGHNEFLEAVTYAPIRKQTEVTRQIGWVSDQFRVTRLLRNLVNTSRTERDLRNVAERRSSISSRALLAEEVDTILNHDGGFEAYHRDDQHASSVVAHFRANLERMHLMCSNQGVPLLMIQPPSNRADCPPFKSQFSATTTVDVQQTIGQLLLHARELSRTNLDEAIRIAQNAVQLDPRFASSWYELGQLQLMHHEFISAAESLRRACDEDVCPLRMTSPLIEAMQSASAQFQIPLVNADELLRQMSRSGVPGDDFLVDHVHPSFRGNEEIGITIAQWMLNDGFGSEETESWQQDVRNACHERLQSLSDLYFLKGRQKLEILRLWAAGRSGGPPLVNSSNMVSPSDSSGSE